MCWCVDGKQFTIVVCTSSGVEDPMKFIFYFIFISCDIQILNFKLEV